MAAFEQLIWQNIDVWAIAGNGGIATIDEQRHAPCRDWLTRNGYSIDTLDCNVPINQAIAELHRMLRWEEQFGYTPNPERLNLDALWDGFEFDIPEGGGHVLELVRVDMAWEQNPEWVRGLLHIAQDYSRRQLALGRRFFALLVVAEHSPMIGDSIATSHVPGPFWNSNRKLHLFEA